MIIDYNFWFLIFIFIKNIPDINIKRAPSAALNVILIEIFFENCADIYIYNLKWFDLCLNSKLDHPQAWSSCSWSKGEELRT